MNAQRTAVVASSTVVVLALAGAIWFTGGPETQRQLRLDGERVLGLKTLSSAITRYRRSNQTWPSAQRELVDGVSLTRLPTDPVSAEPFEYRPLDDDRFELCATFAHRSRDESPEDFWFHDAGERCFSFDTAAADEPASREPRRLAPASR